MSVELDCCLKSASCSPWQAGSRLCVCASISTAIPKMERDGGWGAKRMKYWLAPLKAEARSTLCSRGKRGGEEKLKWKSEVTEFIRSVGSEPWTCLWVSVAVPVHVFSLSSGRPIRLRVYVKALSLCQPSHLVSVFFVFSQSCDCLQTCFRPSQGNLSLDWMVIKERLPWTVVSHFLLLPSFSTLCCIYLHPESIT